MDSSFEHVAVIPPRALRGVPRLDPGWFDKFSAIDTCDIADQVGRLYTMEGITALYSPTPRLVGRALTVKPWPGDGLAIHGAASMVEDGDVLVVDQRGYTGVSSAGFNVLTGPRARGLRGFVVDGALRDVDDFAKVGFPVFGRSRAAHSSSKRHPGEINVPIACGGVIVEPGDLIVADASGVVVIPGAHVARVWEAVAAALAKPAPDVHAVAEADERRKGNYDRAFRESSGVLTSAG